VTVGEAIEWLDRLFIFALDAGPRKEDRKKAIEVAALCGEIERALAHLPKRSELVIVDAASGKGYAGLAAATLVARQGRRARVILIERDARRVESAQQAAGRLHAPGVTVEHRLGDAGDRTLWPDAPSLVLALHACGAAADEILSAATDARAARLLVVPCCTPAEERPAAERLGIPRHAPVRRAFLEALRAAERTLRLESLGWATEVVPFVAPTVTPYHLAWRARRVGEPGRMRAAAERLARMTAG
jgi:precorrin-6B methylase 2